MTFEVRLLVVSLATFAIASVLAGAVVPLLVRRLRATTPSVRAARLWWLRLAPVVFATCATALAAAAFFVYEQREYLESTGFVLPAAAALAAACWLTAIERGVRLAVATRRTRRRWLATARPLMLPGASVKAYAVSTPFPLVAVVGIWRPVLVIAESVLAACTPAELRAIVAHENRHVRTRDNLRRTLLALAPDPLAWLPCAQQLRARWNDAIEEAADDAAAGTLQDGRLVLAEALIRVARLGTSRPTIAELPASAFFRGEGIERRVRRLLVPADQAPGRSRSQWLPFAAAGAVAMAALALDSVHHIVELGVRFLP